MHVRIENRNSEPVIYEVFTFKPAGPTCGGSGLNRTYRVGVRFFIGLELKLLIVRIRRMDFASLVHHSELGQEQLSAAWI